MYYRNYHNIYIYIYTIQFYNVMPHYYFKKHNYHNVFQYIIMYYIFRIHL